MERVHQLLAEGAPNAEDVDFWVNHWHHIASAKVSLESVLCSALGEKDEGSFASIVVVTLGVFFSAFIELFGFLRADGVVWQLVANYFATLVRLLVGICSGLLVNSKESPSNTS